MKRNLFIAGYYCVLLGILGILAIILFGFLSCCLHLDERYFYIALASGLILSLISAACCMRRRCQAINRESSEEKK
jgi:hypothetical protein